MLFENAPEHAAHAELVSRCPSGEIGRITYAQFGARTRQLMGALDHLGLERGDRIETLAWNSARHLEAYFGVPCTGRVLHTLNLRLSPEDPAFIIGDAGDRAVLVDADQLPLLEQAFEHVPALDHVIVLSDTVPETSIARSTPTARPSSTPWPVPATPPCPSDRGMRCCHRSPCFTPTPGACPTPPPRSGPSRCTSQAPSIQPRSSNCWPKSGSPWRPGCPRSGSGWPTSLDVGAAGCPTSATSCAVGHNPRAP